MAEAVRNVGADKVGREPRQSDACDAVGLATIDASANPRFLTVNDQLCGMSGYSRAELVGAAFASVFHPADRRSICDLAGRVAAGDHSSFSVVRRLVRNDQTIVVADVAYVLLSKTEAITVVRPAAEEARLLEREKFLAQTLAHRTRNLLTIVQVLARQVAQHAATPEEFETQFGARLAGIAATHDLVSATDLTGADLAALVRQQLRLIGRGHEGRVDYDGPPLLIRPSAAQHLGMALHELADNACKFGALSGESGRVEIRWSGEDARFRLSWSEIDGPLAAAPTRSGFGEMVLKELVAYACNATAELAYGREGVRWRMEAPLDAVIVERPSA